MSLLLVEMCVLIGHEVELHPFVHVKVLFVTIT
jgi:hypothetical protein